MYFCDFEEKLSTAMVNNFTNINKMNNHILPQIIEHKNKTKSTTYVIWKSMSWLETGIEI